MAWMMDTQGQLLNTDKVIAFWYRNQLNGKRVYALTEDGSSFMVAQLKTHEETKEFVRLLGAKLNMVHV